MMNKLQYLIELEQGHIILQCNKTARHGGLVAWFETQDNFCR